MEALKQNQIIGSGEDGCVFKSWPCARTGTSTNSINPDHDTQYVSKIVKRDDDESMYIQAATRILGPDLAKQYTIHLKGECAPANSSHPPPQGQDHIYQTSKAALLAWTKKNEACDTLKQELVQGKNITGDHKVMYINKYPITLDEWANTTSIKLSAVHAAIPPFLQVLQKLFQGNVEQLINIDLHAGNMFVKTVRTGAIQFGLADFGRCLLKQSAVQNSGISFFGKYLCENTAVYDLYALYNQIPLEARLLNFCFKKSLEHSTPGDLVRAWQSDKLVIEHTQLKDAILYNTQRLMNTLLTKPLFIRMLEYIQSISQKLRLYEKNPSLLTQSLSQNEKIVLEYIITRYAIVSPMNMIASVCMKSYLNPIELITFVGRAMIAPYVQVGSSLSTVVESVERADMGIVWSDITNGH